MSSSRGVGLYLTLLLALLCDASEDFPAQREITDEDGLQREMRLWPEELDFLMMQRPIIPDHSKIIGRPVFSPRSVGPSMVPEVDFPPAFPNIGNLQDICRFSKAPVRYPKDMFPQSGFGHEHRQADAINQLQSWYGVCCGINGAPEEQICCAEQAWKKSLSAYCEIESGIKTVQYFCCMKRGKAKWSCFDKEASDSSYHISSEVSHGRTPKKIRGFKYNSSACKG
ncbi:extracellular matrix protein 1-like isoform X2 [Cyprinus carpio]|uniref:Extracellular matrix protein 1-like isoform X2 n=1 Tax=Cyprinus carpio TaxID=7962 RepID=A0A9R0AF67_CYPCA|nr:extracellular matrix protein 1-like isoform X2 [Cyprinus carpio]